MRFQKGTNCSDNELIFAQICLSKSFRIRIFGMEYGHKILSSVSWKG